MTEAKINWLPWSKKAFQKGKDLDIPILLDISAVWCHWCHVMDKTTYADRDVAKLIESGFVPIRVDRDQRPDIDRRYNMGGWPTTVFLTPDGEVLTGATYVPPNQMVSLLQRVRRFYQMNKHKIRTRSNQPEKERIIEPSTATSVDQESSQSIIDHLTLEIASSYDSVYGGFGEAPKFPHSEALALALLEHHLQGQKALMNIVTKTLKKMRSSDIYDEAEGGFFRYSTRRDWSRPHYEKMGEDNAKLLINYLEAYQATGYAPFKETAQEIIKYVETNLSDLKNGGFYGSQDADEEYYQLSRSERRNRIPPKIDKTIYTNWNALMISAFLQASTLLGRPDYQRCALQTVDLLLNRSFSPEEGMYHYYSAGERHIPSLLADQAAMIKCLVDAYQQTSQTRFLHCAEKIATFVLDNLCDDAGGCYDRPKNVEALGALRLPVKQVIENSRVADAFLRLNHLTGNEEYWSSAQKILEYFAPKYQRYGVWAAGYGLAIDLYLYPMRVHIVGSKEDSVTRRLLHESLRAYNPLKVIEILDPQVHGEKLMKLQYPILETSVAYVCFSGKCVCVENPEEIALKITPRAA